MLMEIIWIVLSLLCLVLGLGNAEIRLQLAIPFFSLPARFAYVLPTVP